MPAPPRKRTAAQRKANGEEEPLLAEEILDEQGQETQIRQLRQKNTSDDRQAQIALDVGVLTCLFITIMQFFGHMTSPTPIFSIVALLQMSILPFSLSPNWFKFIPTISPDNHLYCFSIQLTMACCAIFLRWYHGNGADMEAIELNEVAKWAMPALVVGAIDMQRRSERQAEQKLRLLEGMKYDLKGA